MTWKYWTLSLIFISCVVDSCSSSSKSPSPSAASKTSSATSLVSALKYYNHFPFNNVYTLHLTIGAQNIEAVLDTGSSNLLVIGSEDYCSGCVNEYGYSSVYTPGTGSKELSDSWAMSFAPIGQAQIQGYQDTVSFEGDTLSSYSFGVATSEQGIPNIWGIAYAPVAQPATDPLTPFFDALVSKYNLKNEFSLSLCALKSGSSATFGGYDADLAKLMAQVQWTPVVAKSYYSISMTRMYVSAGTSDSSANPLWLWEPSNTDTVIIDSGTNPVVLPAQQVTGLVSVLQSLATQKGVSIPASFWPTATAHGSYASLSDADIAKFPNIYLDLVNFANSSQTFTLAISPSTYFQTREDGQRFFGVEAGSGIYILGTVFMENYIVLHDRGILSEAVDSTAKVGFYPIAGFCQ